jgi:hypothetical protein
MQEFFNREIKRNDAQKVIQTVEFMFKDIKNTKLRRYFSDALTKHVSLASAINVIQKALDFKTMTNFAFIICMEQSEEKKINFLFDVFSGFTE